MAKVGQGIQMGLSWVPAQDGFVPPCAIEAGPGVFIARTQHEGDILPGKVVPRNRRAYFPWGGLEHERCNYEVLCDSALPETSQCYYWEQSCDGFVPKRSVVAGMTCDGAPLYLARTYINEECVVGKIHEGHSHGYFPYGGEERRERNYEVMVWRKK